MKRLPTSVFHLGRRLARLVLRAGTLAGLAFLTLALGYVAGWKTVPSRTPGEAASLTEPTASKPESRDARTRPVPASHRRVSPMEQREALKNRLPVLTHLNSDGPDARLRAARALAEIMTWDSNTLRDALALLSESPRLRSVQDLQVRLLMRWATVDPRRALAYALESDLSLSALGGYDSATEMVMIRWALSDPSSAWTAWQALPVSQRPHSNTLTTLIRELGGQDFELARRAAESLTGDDRKAAWKGLGGLAVSPAQRPEVLGALMELPSGTLRAEGLANLMHAWRRAEGPDAVQAWFDEASLATEERHLAEERFARTWYFDNRDAAIDWLLSRADTPERRSRILERITNMWVYDDPVGVGNWLLEQGLDAGAAPAMRLYADRLAINFPEQAVAWARSIPDATQRQQALERVVKRIEERHPNRLEELLASSR